MHTTWFLIQQAYSRHFLRLALGLNYSHTCSPVPSWAMRIMLFQLKQTGQKWAWPEFGGIEVSETSENHLLLRSLIAKGKWQSTFCLAISTWMLKNYMWWVKRDLKALAHSMNCNIIDQPMNCNIIDQPGNNSGNITSSTNRFNMTSILCWVYGLDMQRFFLRLELLAKCKLYLSRIRPENFLPWHCWNFIATLVLDLVSCMLCCTCNSVYDNQWMNKYYSLSRHTLTIVHVRSERIKSNTKEPSAYSTFHHATKIFHTRDIG